MNPADLLLEIKELMTLAGENPFKARAYEKAAQAIAGIEDLKERAQAGTLTEIEGVGKGIAHTLTEFLIEGKTTERDSLLKQIPPGIFELTRIPGLGPKKAKQIIEELGVTTIGELEYACQENRLIKLKGFGEKAQARILESIEFYKSTAGQIKLGDALPWAEGFLPLLQKTLKGHTVEETGALRRRLEILEKLDYLIEGTESLKAKAQSALETYKSENPLAIPVEFHFASKNRWGYELVNTSSTAAHWEALGSPAPFDAPSEEAFYEKLGLAFIPPEARETGVEVALAKAGRFPQLLPLNGIQGVFHNHTTRSDGVATLEEMIVAAKERGFKYIGISDHSQSAFYAQGLKVPDLLSQEKEIREAQERHPDIKIFWGIESDILADGQLDYEPQVLKTFDFVVASIHSRFQMDRKAMTERILTAIRNPATRFLGHATGRLLLGRKGYDCDMEAIIKEAAAHDVAIEINAHPARLDIDWRWGPQLREAGTCVSVNPDAHETAGLDDVKYGVAIARKALLPKNRVINSGSVAEVEKWLLRR
jgi:DNA polymerase (family 10)